MGNNFYTPSIVYHNFSLVINYITQVKNITLLYDMLSLSVLIVK